MSIIAIYVAGQRYVLEDSTQILSRANQALATLERYKLRLDEVSGTLSALEIEDFETIRVQPCVSPVWDTALTLNALVSGANQKTSRDPVIPIALGERLFALAHQPKQFVRFPEGGHETLDDYGALQAAHRFIDGSQG